MKILDEGSAASAAEPSGAQRGPATADAAEGARAEGPAAVGLRERKKRARREALIDATHRLVARDGLDAVTVDAICEEAGVSTRTFFNYFDSKDDAVLGHAPWPLTDEAAETFATGGPTGDLLADLRVLVTHVLETPPTGHDRMRRGFELAAHEPRLLAKHIAWMERSKGELTALLTRRLGDDPSHPLDVVTTLVLFVTHTAVMRWDANGGEGDAADQVDAVIADIRALVAP
ncbi:TetR/AcrR family transcriptional regulator [Cellulomonas alba]|uniref:Helix-turn-helix domain-containing protein n=1 Tax=Cellulomonas alba TaxID=3053467 RepID=A0ABT7SIP9_9CELL|nr:TetR/AcrR family transcriptional regulator [Cellulomonas alba]MDM7856057.1 helix-turn-helix domain-containing protein [Cellulomonas alba]